MDALKVIKRTQTISGKLKKEKDNIKQSKGIHLLWWGNLFKFS